MSDPNVRGDWPVGSQNNSSSMPSQLTASEQLEHELRLKRKKRMPVWLSLAIGAGLAVLAFAVFASQKGSFADAGAAVDGNLRDAKATSVAAGQDAADATGNAARAAGENIDTALDRAAAGDEKTK